MLLLPSSSLYFSLSSHSDIQKIPPHFTFIQTPFGFPFLAFFFIASSANLNFGIRVNHFQTLKRVFGSLSLLSLLVLLLPDTWECFTFLFYILWFMIWFIIHVLPAIKTHFMEARVQRPYMRRVLPPLLPITSMDFN